MMKYPFLFVVFSMFLSGNSLAMDAADQENSLVVMLEGSKPHSHTYLFSPACKEEVIDKDPLSTLFAGEISQLKNLAIFMQGKVDRKNKILYATNKEVLFALYYIAKNPTHFDAVVLRNSAFHPEEFVSSETFFRDIPTLEKCEKIVNDIPIVFASGTSNDQILHAALRLMEKNAHLSASLSFPGNYYDCVVEKYSVSSNSLHNKSQYLNENAVKAVLDRKEKERMHRYKEYGWWIGSALFVLFLSHKSGLLEKIVNKLSFK